jgi:integrase
MNNSNSSFSNSNSVSCAKTSGEKKMKNHKTKKNKYRGIYRHKNSPFWYMSFMVPNEGRRQISTEKTNIDDALLVRAQILVDIKNNCFNPDGSEKKYQFTFDEIVEKYAEFASSRQKSFDRTTAYIINLLKVEFSNTLLNDLNTERIEQFQTKLLNKHKKDNKTNSKERKVATVNRYLTVLRAMLNKASDYEMISDDTLKKIAKVKQLNGASKRKRFLSIEEMDELIEACGTHLKPIVITALNSGMRKGEILNLTWDENVDLKHNFIFLKGDETKNREDREIPLTPALKKCLISLPRRLNTNYVFFDETGKRYGDVKKGFKAALTRAKIHNFRFHDLRHTFASHLIMSGTPLLTLSKYLGHRDIKSTEIYANLGPDHYQESIQNLPWSGKANDFKKAVSQ